MNIMVVDDDPMTRKLLSFLLKGENFDVVEAESIREARALLERDTPWLILLDVQLPDGDGFSFCRYLQAEEPDIPVVMLTSRGASTDKVLGLKTGADDYVVKPFDPSELLERVKAVLRRTSHLQPHLSHDDMRVGDLELSMGTLKLRIGDKQVVNLTPTEMRILSCLMANAGKVLDRSRIAEVALGYDYQGSSNVIDVYIRRLRHKLEENPTQPKYIETIVGSGYRICKPA